MNAAFSICISLAALGALYAPGIYTAASFVFIALSCLPLFLAGLCEPAFEDDAHRPPGPALFWGLVALGLANLAVVARSVERSPSEILSAQGFVSIAVASTTKRYLEGGSSGNPVVMALSLFLLYRLGAADSSVRGWRKAMGFLPLLLYTLLTTEKWAMFLSGIFFLSGLFVSRPFGAAARSAFRYLVLFVLLGGGLAAGAMLLRGGEAELRELPVILFYYVLAPYSAMGHWLVEEASLGSLSFGALTFVGPLDALGLTHREAGVYTVNFGLYGMETNIYTAWRYLVEDFSLFGPFLLNLALALLFFLFCTVGRPAAARAVAGFAIFCAFLSLNVTPFVHNSVAFGMALSLAYTVIAVGRTPAGIGQA